MRRNARLMGVLLAAVFAGACGKAEQKAKLVGDVTDVSGAAVGNVQVAVGGKKVTTNADGRFTAAVKGSEEAMLVKLTKEGFVTSSRSLPLPDGTESYLKIVMMPLAEPQPMSADTGGKVVGARNSAVEAPPGAFITASGKAVTGEVQVRLTPYDPAISAEALAYPGELVALTKEGKTVPLQTYGLLDLTVTQDGKALQVAPGQTITIRAPMTSKGEVPSEMGMWRYDVDRALWLELPEGVWDAATRTWATTLGPGFALDTTQNCDRPLDFPACIQGVVVDSDWNAVLNASVTARVDPEFGIGQIYSRDWTWSEGTFCMTVARDTPILLTVEEPSGRVTERRFRSGNLINRDYPKVCGSSQCMQLIPIVVGTDDPGSGQEACEQVMATNPFAGTCAPELDDFYTCFKPEGACVSDIDPGIGTGMPSTEITWDNGAKVTSGFAALSGFVSKYYAANGDLCATITPSGNGATITVTGGGSVTISTDDDGSMSMRCGGITRELDAKQTAAMMACGGTGGEGETAACTPKPGSFTGACTFKNDCKSGLDCCAPPFDFSKRQCMIESLCDLLCEQDRDCWTIPGSDVITYACCNGITGARLCLPATACQ